MTLSTTILDAQEFARRLTLKADGTVLAYDDVLGGYSWSSATPATPVTTGTAAQRAAVTGSAGQLFYETDTSVLLQWTTAWKAVGAPGAWTSSVRPSVGTTDSAYEGLAVYENNTGKVMVLRRTTLGSAISGGNPLIWSFVAPLITAGPGVAATGDGSPGTPFVLTSSFPNPVRNASAQVWQDGASIACGSGAYTSDEWYGRRATSAVGQTVSKQTASDTQGSPYCWRQQRDSGNSSTAQMIHEHSMSTEDSKALAGQTVTLSGRVRSAANYSGGSASLALITGTGTDQSVRSGFTGQATAGTGTVTPSASWQTVSVTVTLSSSITQLAIQEAFTPTGTAGTTDALEWKDVRIDRGSSVLTHVPNRYEDDLDAAYLRYVRHDIPLTGDVVARGWVYSATEIRILFALPRGMRASPVASMASSALSDMRIFTQAGGTHTPTAISTTIVSPLKNTVELGFAVTGATAWNHATLVGWSNTPAIGFNARI